MGLLNKNKGTHMEHGCPTIYVVGMGDVSDLVDTHTDLIDVNNRFVSPVSHGRARAF